MGKIKSDELAQAIKLRCPSCGERYIVHANHDIVQDKPIACGECGTVNPREKWTVKEICYIFH